MTFELPTYTPPDFLQPAFASAPLVQFAEAPLAGVAPEGFHATSVYPEYFHVAPGEWQLLRESRMDSVVVQRQDGRLDVCEARRLQAGDRVALGRAEQGEEGILVYTEGFALNEQHHETFSFRNSLTRETSFSIDYDQLYSLLNHDRTQGFILWVLGPAVVFDQDARDALCRLIEGGYVHGLLAGNALATHDLEGTLFGTALGQEIYSKKTAELGHYKHLDTLNTIRKHGSIAAAVEAGIVDNGVMHALNRHDIPFVLAGSIRDDGPLPEVESDVYRAQDAMRQFSRKATTVLCLATQLHTIATGNMTPSYQVTTEGDARPVYFYSVDMSEFAVSKLTDRGSLTARSILTNVQDFVVTLERGLRVSPE